MILEFLAKGIIDSGRLTGFEPPITLDSPIQAEKQIEDVKTILKDLGEVVKDKQKTETKQ